MIKQQSQIYMMDIQEGSSEISKELVDVTNWEAVNWLEILHGVIDSYWFQIAENVDTSGAVKAFL